MNFAFMASENLVTLKGEFAPNATNVINSVAQQHKNLKGSGQSSENRDVERSILDDPSCPVRFAKTSEYGIKRGSKKIEEAIMMKKRLEDVAA